MHRYCVNRQSPVSLVDRAPDMAEATPGVELP